MRDGLSPLEVDRTGVEANTLTPDAMAPVVSIVVMAYNEAESLTGVLNEIDETFADGHTVYEVIIVDDGSSDATGRIARASADGTPHRRVIHHETNRGLGEVYRSGFTAATGRFVTFLPADGQFPAAIVKRFLVLSADADLVLGRVESGNRDAVSALLSRLERRFYGLLFGALPEYQGIMMFRRDLLSELDVALGGRGWRVLMEIIVKSVRRGKTLRSETTPLRPRTAGRSKVRNFRSVWANATQGLSLWLRLQSAEGRGRATTNRRHIANG